MIKHRYNKYIDSALHLLINTYGRKGEKVKNTMLEGDGDEL